MLKTVETITNSPESDGVLPALKARTDLTSEELPESPTDRIQGKKLVRRKQILDLVRRQGPLPRVDIAAKLGYNLRTVSELVDELVAEELLLEERSFPSPSQPPKKNPVGRPPVPITLNVKAACALGIEVSRNVCVFQSMDLAGTVLNRTQAKLPATLKDPKKLAVAFEEHLTDFFRSHKEPLPPIAGVGLTFSGIYFSKEGDKYRLNPGPEAIREVTERLTGAPVFVHEHTAMLTFGEMWFQETDPKTFVCVHVGQGLGSALVEEGRMWYGFDGRAADLGHLQLGDRGVTCFCGREACLENVASGAGLERLAAKAGLTVQGRPATADDLAEMARTGSAAAKKIWKQFGTALGAGLDTLVVMTDPEVLVIGGRLSRHADLFLDHAVAEIEKGAKPEYRRSTKVVVSQFHENAIFTGACACVLHRIFGSSHQYIRSVI